MPSTKPSRTDFARQFQRCWFCWTVYPLETHEIARGVHRSKAVVEPTAWLRVCNRCHDTVAGMTIAQQLAMKKVNDPENYDRVAVNRLRGRAAEAVTEADVDAEVERM